MINFMSYKKIYFALSSLVIGVGLVSLSLWGLVPSVDFVGGTVWELQLPQENADKEGLHSQIKEMISSESVTISQSSVNDSGVLTLRTAPISQEQKQVIQQNMSEATQSSVVELRFETVGPSLGRELLLKTITGVLLAALLIFIYIVWRFKDRMYGLSAILAMLHDSFIVVGVFSVLGHFWGVEIDALFVTAVLTILSFSVHDTIVVYDRIRESLRKYPKMEFVEIVNKAVSETLVRSINNSLTIVFMLLALLLLGGESMRWFVLALLVGVIAGTYSSTFTAAPLLIFWDEHFGPKRKQKKSAKK